MRIGRSYIYAMCWLFSIVYAQGGLALTPITLPSSIFMHDSDGIIYGKESLKYSISMPILREKEQVKIEVVSDMGEVKLSQLHTLHAVYGEINFTDSCKLDVPGFYKLKVYSITGSKDSLVAESSFGYEPEKIDSAQDNPDDFNLFWEATLRALSSVDPQFTMEYEESQSNEFYNVYRVSMFSFGNEKIFGYYAQPLKGEAHPVSIECMGYSSKAFLPSVKDDSFAHFTVSVRGQGANEISWDKGSWILNGIESKESYYYRGAYMDIIRAIDFVCSRPEIDTSKIVVQGGSQGGAFAAIAAALDKRVKSCIITVPFLSDFKDYFRIATWPASEFQEYMSTHTSDSWVRVYQLLSYFDIKNFASMITCPLYMAIGLQDHVCPPHINFAFYNQVNSTKAFTVYKERKHEVDPSFYPFRTHLHKQIINCYDEK